MMANDDAVSRTITIQNERGLHATAATKFVRLAGKYPCDVSLAKDGHEVNGKSIMGVLMLAASKGQAVTIKARGERAAEAVEMLVQLVDDKFGEER